ncbi:MAG: phospho-N-acetylmuramoyl-pentapeptide-transferase [Christensenellales bacterium]|jgi:phospho-N-acetylmuramoyl-pentapeptide-transferase
MLYWIGAIFVAFAAALTAGPLVIPGLQKLKFGQVIRAEGPQWHEKKMGTPTMGGAIFIIGVLISCFVFMKSFNPATVALLILVMGNALIGLADDLISVLKKRNMGLRSWQKLALQFLIACIVGVFIIRHFGSVLRLPFTSETVELGWWYLPILVFAIVGTVNSTNLTDGLDGLLGGTALVYFAVFTIILVLFPDLGNHDQIVFSAAMLGGLLGFLCFNVYPARVFMGDFGSLMIGGAVVWMAISTGLTLWLPVMGGVFAASSVSDILQVGSYKLRGKRIFKMAPLHHHFEMKGIPETKIVSMYIIVTTLLCLAGLAAIKV